MKLWFLFPFIIVFFLTSVLTFFAWYIFYRVWVTETKLRNLSINFSLSIFIVLYLFLFLEIIFGTFFVHSDGNGFTLASKRWFQTYWNPINSDGYRDFEHEWGGKKILFILGDSFAAGHGIKNISNRFSGVLQEKLGTGWTVAVLAQNGWDPIKEYKALVNHPKNPKRIIVSYFINDIESAAKSNGFNRPKQLVKQPNRIIGVFVNHSFFLNCVYWRLYRGGMGHFYWNYLKHAYNDTKIWESHKQELLEFINYANQINSEIAFVVWPNLRNIHGSLKFTSKIVAFLEGQNVKVLDLGKHFSGRNPKNLIVNKLDGHPNTDVNAEVAQLLYKLLSPWD